jgi:hypothetical protein
MLFAVMVFIFRQRETKPWITTSGRKDRGAAELAEIEEVE